MGDFQTAFDYSMGNEGGYNNDPLDRGGETNHGLTATTARSLGYTGSMRDMTLEDAKRLYIKGGFWQGLDDVEPQSVATAIFDVRLNGPGYGNKIVQKALNDIGFDVSVDGGWGPETAGAVAEADPGALVRAMAAETASHYENVVANDPSQQHWYNGWMNRAQRLADLAEDNPITTTSITGILIAAGIVWFYLRRRKARGGK